MTILNEELVRIMEECYLSTKVTASVLFPNRFYRPFPSITDEIFRVIDDDNLQKVLVIAPRGWGKTSTINLAYPAKKILFHEKKFIVPISNTATQAVMQGENLKRELLTNTMISRIFGNLRSDTFSKDMWVTANGIAVLPRGSGQQVRGILYGDYRPDLIICDDLEDAESVRSEEQRAKLKEWFFADVLNSVNLDNKDWKIVVIGTLLHEASLLAELMEDPSWHKVHISLCDEQYNSNWPDYMNNEAIAEMVEGYRRQGLLDTFYREFMGIPIAKESASFKSEYFRYYEESSEVFQKNKRNIESVVLVDPAKTTKDTSAHTAIVGVGIDTVNARIYVRDIVAGRLHPDQMYTESFEMADRLGAKVIGIEVTSLNEFIVHPFKTAMLRRGRVYNLVELKARGAKEERIAALVPFYRMGHVYHNKNNCGPLEAQLVSYPRSKKWDIMDALAYIVEMMELGERYFMPDDKEMEELDAYDQDEYWELEQDYERPLTGWRTI